MNIEHPPRLETLPVDFVFVEVHHKTSSVAHHSLNVPKTHKAHHQCCNQMVCETSRHTDICFTICPRCCEVEVVYASNAKFGDNRYLTASEKNGSPRARYRTELRLVGFPLIMGKGTNLCYA